MKYCWTSPINLRENSADRMQVFWGLIFFQYVRLHGSPYDFQRVTLDTLAPLGVGRPVVPIAELVDLLLDCGIEEHGKNARGRAH